MANYLEKWKNVDVDGWQLINENTNKAFENLLVHVRSGYLSDIPPGMGTNRNENLHKQLKHFLRNRLSIQTVEALFTHIFYVHNGKRSPDNKMCPVPPIWEKQ